MNGGHLLLDVEAISRKAAGDIEELAGDDVADAGDDDEGDDSGDGDSEYARNAPGLETAHGGSQQKGERERERERDEQLAGEEEDQDGNDEREEGTGPGELATSSGRHTTSRSLVNRVACPGKNTSRELSQTPEEGVGYRPKHIQRRIRWL
jgi:hypothetical protein